MSFINSENDQHYVQLASKKHSDVVQSEEMIVSALLDKPTDYGRAHKYQQAMSNTQETSINQTSIQISAGSPLQKVLKRTPPILNSKLRISCQAGSYPLNRSANL